ncbi:YtxH domain-containing protein [Nonomuraea dietziae]|uniref:YtxH domain-containing protein n=1 Tax=Nonomuraea dietziae TaxID=65515 RepID=UPI0033C50042
MRYRVMFAVGVAVGYVLGSRAGRERYEQIKRTAHRVADSPRVQEAAGLVGAQVSKVAGVARLKVGDTLVDKIPFLGKNGRVEDHLDTGTGWPESKKDNDTARVDDTGVPY